MVKPEWGTKRACPKCGTRFYDLTKDEPVGDVVEQQIRASEQRSELVLGAAAVPDPRERFAIEAEHRVEARPLVGQALAELVGHAPQLVVGHRLEVVLDGVDGLRDRLELAEDLALSDAEELVDDHWHGRNCT